MPDHTDPHWSGGADHYEGGGGGHDGSSVRPAGAGYDICPGYPSHDSTCHCRLDVQGRPRKEGQ